MATEEAPAFVTTATDASTWNIGYALRIIPSPSPTLLSDGASRRIQNMIDAFGPWIDKQYSYVPLAVRTEMLVRAIGWAWNRENVFSSRREAGRAPEFSAPLTGTFATEAGISQLAAPFMVPRAMKVE